jgi:heme a synthase
MAAEILSDGEARVHNRAVRLWLYAVAAMVLAMVLIGGATRLTESGLSITEWQPVMGALPPLSEAQWLVEFHKYQAIPQYRELNQGMSLDAFKTIFWWEWTHRLIGRLIGVVFLLPLLWFLWRGWIGPGLRGRLWLIFGLGALQGAVGWWMVASGLVHRVEVSQYRLATHLVLACVIYIAILWTALGLGERTPEPSSPRIRASAIGLVILVLAQIYLGALVAGLRAGYVYNTWPLMDGSFVPQTSRLFSLAPSWRNFFENTLTVQFDHRMLAYTIWICVLLHVIDVTRTAGKGRPLAGAIVLFVAVTLQAALGIATLL